MNSYMVFWTIICENLWKCYFVALFTTCKYPRISLVLISLDKTFSENHLYHFVNFQMKFWGKYTKTFLGTFFLNLRKWETFLRNPKFSQLPCLQPCGSSFNFIQFDWFWGYFPAVHFRWRFEQMSSFQASSLKMIS